MKNPDRLWLDICYRFSDQSKCKSRHVGCLIVHEDRVIGQGYNGAPEGSSCEDCPRPKCRGETTESTGTGSNLDLAICAHAEANAIGYCARHGISTRGAILYCTTLPCSECAKLIVAAGIKEVVYDTTYPHDAFSKTVLGNAGLVIRNFQI